MKQKCPNCGHWCEAHENGLLEKAGNGLVQGATKVIDIGSSVGGLFGKKGKKAGGFIGALASGYAGLSNAAKELIAGDDYSFECPQCGYTWSASDIDEDQSEDEQEELQEYTGNITNYLKRKEFDEAIEEAEELINVNRAEGLYWLAIVEYHQAGDIQEKSEKGWPAIQKTVIESALEHIDESIQLFIENEDEVGARYSYLQKAWIYTRSSNSIARRLFIQMLAWDDQDIAKEALDGYKHSTYHLLVNCDPFLGLSPMYKDEEEYNKAISDTSLSEEDRELMRLMQYGDETNLFVNRVSFADRQFLFFVRDTNRIAGCYDDDDNVQWVFTLDQYPPYLTFPVGHPQANTLYIAHPTHKGLYFPYERAENAIFHDKVTDFIRLSQCLGATKITFKWIQGEQIDSTDRLSLNASCEGGKKKVVNVSGQYSGDFSSSSNRNVHNTMDKVLVFDPMKKPYVPDGLEWLNVDKKWQTYVKQRLEGNALSYSIRISSSESVSLSSSRKNSVKISFENLISTVDANFDSSRDTTFSSSQETIWELLVEFRSLKEFDSAASNDVQQNSSLSENERLFFEEVQFCYEDGNMISDADLKYLERKRVKFGVSSDRAETIIQMVQPLLTDSEKEYLDTFGELVEDKTDISPRVRRMLDREADSLGIDEKRKLQLESM